jgi:hypothetical protein
MKILKWFNRNKTFIRTEIFNTNNKLKILIKVLMTHNRIRKILKIFRIKKEAEKLMLKDKKRKYFYVIKLKNISWNSSFVLIFQIGIKWYKKNFK